MTFAEKVYRMIGDLPPDLRQQAIRFIEELAKKKRQAVRKKFSLSWAGGLAQLKGSTTSVELQHAAWEWRN